MTSRSLSFEMNNSFKVFSQILPFSQKSRFSSVICQKIGGSVEFLCNSWNNLPLCTYDFQSSINCRLFSCWPMFYTPHGLSTSASKIGLKILQLPALQLLPLRTRTLPFRHSPYALLQITITAVGKSLVLYLISSSC